MEENVDYILEDEKEFTEEEAEKIEAFMAQIEDDRRYNWWKFRKYSDGTFDVKIFSWDMDSFYGELDFVLGQITNYYL